MNKSIIKNVPAVEDGEKIFYRSKVFKDKQLRNSNSVTVVAEKGQVLKASVAEVLPIKKNGEIIGVIHKCSCGKKTEIRFDFEE